MPPASTIQADVRPNLQVEPAPESIDAARQKILDADAKTGKGYAAEVDKELKPTNDLRMQARVERIGKELAAIANAHHLAATWGDKAYSKFDYTFKVVKGTDINAFSLPGGYVYVYDSLVKYVESDDELAGILGHEISHAAFRHVSILQGKVNHASTAWTLPLLLAGVLAHGASGGLTGAMVGQLATQAQASGWSEEAEEAADYGGFQILCLSKYSPVGLLTVMERFAKDERDRPQIDLGIYRTHPPSLARAEALTKDLNDAGVPIRRSLVSSTLRVEPKPGENGVVELWFNGIRLYGFGGNEALSRADAAAERLNLFFDAVPQLYEARIGPDGNIYGRNREIIDVDEADAEANKETKEQLQQDTLKAIRGALYSYAFRIWQRY